MATQKLDRASFNEAVRGAFQYFCKSGNPAGLDPSEFRNLYSSIPKKDLKFELTTQILSYLFSQADKDKDGKVSLAELQEFLGYFYFSPR